MKLPIRIAGLCAALCFALPVAAFELVHSDGKVSLSAPAKRIATFDLAVLDSLHTLGVDVVGVPKSSYQGSLAGFNELTPVGSLFEPDYAALEQLAPDLIFAGGRSQSAIPQLSQIAPVATFAGNPSEFLESFRTNNLALAEAFGKQEQAQQAIAAIDANVEALHQSNEGKTGAFLFVIRNNVMAHAPGDRFGYAYDLAGLKSVVPPKEQSATATPRPEPGSARAKAAEAARAEVIASIAKAEPDWLIVLARGAINGGEKTAADTLAGHAQLSQTRAFKEGRVLYVDPNGWYVIGGGLSNLTEITEAMLAAMQ